MPSGEDSDTANDYPQRCERARKQTLSNNTAPQEDISVSHGFRPALPKHTLDFHFLKAHLYPPFKGLEQLCSQQTIQHCLLLQRGTAIRAVTLKSYLVLRSQGNLISQSQEPAMLSAQPGDRRTKLHSPLWQEDTRCLLEDTTSKQLTFSFWLRNWGFCQRLPDGPSHLSPK